MKRRIAFAVSADGNISPSTPQYAGVEGEHNAAEVVLDVSAWAAEGFLYRVEFVDGLGAGHTENDVTPVENQITVELPSQLINAGGRAAIRLAASVVRNGKEVQTFFTTDAGLYFSEETEM